MDGYCSGLTHHLFRGCRLVELAIIQTRRLQILDFSLGTKLRCELRRLRLDMSKPLDQRDFEG
jgi:hypothetical protein